MPAPRLELRWVDRRMHSNYYEYTVECEYNLVLRLDSYDIRAERVDDDGNDLPKAATMAVRMGGTRSTRTAAERYRPGEDKVDTPFRDHSHAKWDSEQLGGLPVYAVADGRAMLVEYKPAGEKARSE